MQQKNLFKIDGVVNTTNAPEPKVGESVLGGTTKKDFRGCSNYLLQKMFEDLSKEDTSYVTYLNNYIKARQKFIKSGVPVPPYPDFIVSLFKESRYKFESKDAYANVASSIVGNMLHIPVAYNSIYTDENDIKYILSVNFLSNGKGFVSLNDCVAKTPYLDYWIDFKYWEDVISKLGTINVPTYLSNKNNHLRYQRGCKLILSEGKRETLIEEFISTYLYRKYVIRDRDFNKKNVGFVVDKGNRTLEWAPNFDVEAGLNRGRFYDFDPPQVYPDLKYLYSKYPQIIDDFMSRIDVLSDLKGVDSELSRYIDDPKIREYFLFQIRDNVREIKEAYSKITEPTQMK